MWCLTCDMFSHSMYDLKWAVMCDLKCDSLRDVLCAMCPMSKSAHSDYSRHFSIRFFIDDAKTITQHTSSYHHNNISMYYTMYYHVLWCGIMHLSNIIMYHQLSSLIHWPSSLNHLSSSIITCRHLSPCPFHLLFIYHHRSSYITYTIIYHKSHITLKK